MKLTHLAPVAALLLLIGTGCSKDRGTSHGAGTLNIKLEMDDHIDLITRTANTKATPDLASFTLEVLQGEEIVEKLPTIGSNTSPSLTLEEGDYTVNVYSQPFTAPAFDTPVYGDSQDFSLLAGETKNLTMECVQTNAGVIISYTDEFKAQYTTYSTRIDCTSGSLDFSGADATRTGYFPAGYATLTITADGKEYQQEILLKGQRLYSITIKAEPQPVATGEATISISVSTAVTNEEMEITFPNDSGGQVTPGPGQSETLFRKISVTRPSVRPNWSWSILIGRINPKAVLVFRDQGRSRPKRNMLQPATTTLRAATTCCCRAGTNLTSKG